MKPKLAAVLKHLIDTLLVVGLAATVVLAIWEFASINCSQVLIWISQVNFFIFVLAISTISALFGWTFPEKITPSIWALKLWPKHWGLVIRVSLGIFLTLGLAHFFGIVEIESDIFAMLVLRIIIAGLSILLVGYAAAFTHLQLRKTSRVSIKNQLTNDEPISCLEENRFPEYEVTARRILERLKLGKDTEARGPNIALIGPYGSGKTSICNLVKDIYKKELDQGIDSTLVFCRFEAWQFLTAEGAIRGLINQIVTKVEELVDCTGLDGLPEKYLDVLRACPNGWFGTIATMLRKKQSPDEVVRAIQDVLLRIGKRLIVFVDDFDRLESRSEDTQHAIAASLNQLQNLANVQYVLCVGPIWDGVGADLLKLTRFQELMPEVNGKNIIECLKVLRDEAIRGDGNLYLPWDLDRDDPLQYYHHKKQLTSTLVSQLINLIKTPRELKAVELETTRMWSDGLQGEIKWYDLLLMNTIKISEPGVFEWLMREPELFLEGQITIGVQADEEKQEAQNEIEAKLKTLLKTKTKLRIELVEQVLLDLFPSFMKGLGGLAQNMTRTDPQSWEQRISSAPKSGSSYFRRYFSGGVPNGEVPDQTILQYIRNIAENGIEPTEFQERYLASFEKLTNDFNVFVGHSGLLTEELSREVCDCILEWLCVRDLWSIWNPTNEYVRAVIYDVKEIFEKSGEFEFVQARKKDFSEPRDMSKWTQWVNEWTERLAKQDIIVAIGFAQMFYDVSSLEIKIKPLLGTKLKEVFLNEEEIIWEKAKGYRSYLGMIVGVLKYNEDYENLREGVTKSIVKRAEVDKSDEFAESVVMSLMECWFSVGRPDEVEGYKFSVTKKENCETYNMDMMLSLIAGWKGRRFTDPVSAKGYDCLVKGYAEELEMIDKSE